MNDKDKRQQMSKTLYGSKTSQYKMTYFPNLQLQY